MKSPILGGAGTYRSRNLAYNRLVNLYPELVDTHDGRAPGALYGCPGLDLVVTVGIGPIRGQLVAANGLLYVVSGNTLYSVSTSYAVTAIGTIGSYYGVASIIDNGSQLLVVDGVGGWVWNYRTSTYSQVLPGTVGVVPGQAIFQDGFGVVNQVNTNNFYQSNLNDFTTWQALNYSSADATPDNIIALGEIHREIWIFKQRTSEVWVNAGLNGFVFQRVQGVQIQTGCVAPASVARVGESLVWLGQDEQGAGVVWLANGYVAVRISTHGVEHSIAEMTTISDARAFTYQQEGHTFYVLNFPTGNKTWVFDLNTRLWHERAFFSNGQFSLYRPSSVAFFNGLVLAGDYLNGNIYHMNLDSYTDAGGVRKWLRTWRALPPNQAVARPMRFDRLTISCQTGVGIPGGTNPQFMLRWSDDGGYSWSNEIWTDSNLVGNTQANIIYRRLGSTKPATGLDRLFELSGTDPVPVALIEADLEVAPA